MITSKLIDRDILEGLHYPDELYNYSAIIFNELTGNKYNETGLKESLYPKIKYYMDSNKLDTMYLLGACKFNGYVFIFLASGDMALVPCIQITFMVNEFYCDVSDWVKNSIIHKCYQKLFE